MNNIQTSLRNLRATVEEIKRRPRPAREPGTFITMPIREGSKLLRRVWAREVRGIPVFVDGVFAGEAKGYIFPA